MSALDGIRVLDFTQVIFGPAATQVLADHGADVIKVERPGRGDLARGFGPWVKGESLPFASLNRSKRSIVINLKEEAGLDIIYRLLAETDVMVHNFRPGVMEKIGLDYGSIEARYPRLIYAVGSGYGSSGPYAERNKGGHETMAQALSGVCAKFVGADGGPQRLPLTLADFTGGMLLAQGVLLALCARERSGRGQALETSLLDGMMSLQAWETTGILNSDDAGDDPSFHPAEAGAGGSSHPQGNPLDGGVFRTADGYIMVTGVFGAFDELVSDLCGALGLADLSADPRFCDLAAAILNRDALRRLLEPVFATSPSAAWIDRLEAAGILCAPVRSTVEALDDPQLMVNELIVEMDVPRVGLMRQVGTPLRLAGTPSRAPRPPPSIGEHTDAILGALGFDEPAVVDLHRRGVVA
jgi:crotonobetainyl-CoA:carnitine CoA-transferase CaiB-like acyl-CoA transferase